ncbi:MAG: hypothetical protein SRB1_02005 [Desulfobacteraceae bacterium Eth-SRB1]|nr:MAG: hypothetical protein SRB1_02005 [Desulfobacteraceae bacterium Eth-SRB1]
MLKSASIATHVSKATVQGIESVRCEVAREKAVRRKFTQSINFVFSRKRNL